MFCYRLFSLLCFRFRNVERRFVPDTVCLHGVSHRNLSGWGKYDIQATCAWSCVRTFGGIFLSDCP